MVTTQHAFPSRLQRLTGHIRAVASVLRQIFPCVLEPRVVGGPFRVECQRTAAEVARVAVVRGNLCSGGACKKLIAIKRDKRFGVSRHNIGPLAYDAQA